MNDNDGISTHPTIKIGPDYVESVLRRVGVIGERGKEEKKRKMSVFDFFVSDKVLKLTERCRDVHSEEG